MYGDQQQVEWGQDSGLEGRFLGLNFGFLLALRRCACIVRFLGFFSGGVGFLK